MKKSTLLLAFAFIGLTMTAQIASETFDDGILPDGWTLTTVLGDCGWEFTSVTPSGQEDFTTTAIVYDDDACGQTAPVSDLVILSDVYDMSTLDGDLTLTYDVFFRRISAERFFVDYFDGTDWVNIVTYSMSTGEVLEESFTLTGISNSDFQVRFNYIDPTPEWGWGAGMDTFTLNGTLLTGPANDDCDAAMPLTCATTVTGSTVDATDSGGSAAPDVFYTYTGSGDEETITLSLCDGATDYDSRLRVFDDACNLMSEIVQNDDFCGTQSELEFTSDGITTYTVMVEGFDGGSSGNYSLAVSCEVLSVQDNAIQGFTFFPNPADNVLNINAQREVQTITMFNLLGQKVMEQSINATSSSLNVSSLSKGTYIMQVTSDGQVGSFKVIKK